jgi:hypothetical protein
MSPQNVLVYAFCKMLGPGFGDVAKLLQHLTCKHKALSSNPNTTKNKMLGTKLLKMAPSLNMKFLSDSYIPYIHKLDSYIFSNLLHGTVYVLLSQ